LQSLLRGIAKLEIDEKKLRDDLDLNWEVLAEPVQTVMRRHGIERPYEKLKELTRGQRITPGDMQRFIDGLELPESAKSDLRALLPATYTGNAEQQAREI
jgi:adenylosuccinate lyase